MNGPGSLANINLTGGSTVNNNGTSGIDFNVNGGTINVAATSSTISNNGLGGVIGSGVLGVATNGGDANLTFLNATINNNLDNGVFVSTNTGANVNAIFDLGTVNGNGTTLLTAHNNDGILLQMDGSPSSSLQIINNAQVTGNGNDGVAIQAYDSTNFQAIFSNATITNNGTAPPLIGSPFAPNRAGVDVTTESNSNVNMSFNGLTIGNTAAGGPQNYGFFSNTNTFGQMTASFTTVNLSTNSSNAIGSTVSTNGAATISLTDVIGNNSGAQGALFSVASGGLLNVFSSVNSSFSTNGGAGVLVQVDGATASPTSTSIQSA